jgi:UDP-N-acetylmuramate--alanine ligase
MFNTTRHIHFVGIGGSGMSGLAEVLLNLGHTVSGSDSKDSAVVERLRTLGAQIFIGHNAAAICNADVVVASSAISKSNPELHEASSRRIPIIHRSEMLAELMRLKHGILVAGTHGKTTTTSLVATVLGAAGIDPTVVIGGRLNAFGTNAKLGKSEIFLAEADESDGSFLKLTPTVAVITNIDRDHLDHWSGLDAIIAAFQEFMNKVPFYGSVCACIDDPGVQLALPHVRKKIVSYGLRPDADITAVDVQPDGFNMRFFPVVNGVKLDEVTLKMPGKHNVQNALASYAVAKVLNLNLKSVGEALASFEGVLHRSTLLGIAQNTLVVDDYAHNPRKIEAALRGLRDGYPRHRIIAIFQPHRYSRVKTMMSEFSKSFIDADNVIVTPIYSAGEAALAGATQKILTQQIRCHSFGGNPVPVQPVASLQAAGDLAFELAKDSDSGSIVVSLGAGDVAHVGERVLERLGGKK